MVRKIAGAALKLDTWLQERLGRPYNALLGVGLTIEIVRRIAEAPEMVGRAEHLVGQVLLILLETALLIHQVGALSHRFRDKS